MSEQVTSDPFTSAINVDSNGTRQKIPIDGLDTATNAAKVARTLSKKFNLQKSLLPELICAITELQGRRQWLQTGAADAVADSDTSNSSQLDLEQSIDLFYRSYKDKLKAASFLSLCIQNEEHLVSISENHALLSALARVFREDCPSSPELLYNVSKVVLGLSSFTEFHALLASHRMGSLVLDALILETKRLRSTTTSSSSSSSSNSIESATSNTERDARDDLSTADNDNSAATIDGRGRRSFNGRQEATMTILLSILDNLADDAKARSKMVRSGALLEPILCSLSCSTSSDCVLRALVLLRKACLCNDVASQMSRDCDVVRLLSQFVRSDCDDDTVDHAANILLSVMAADEEWDVVEYPCLYSYLSVMVGRY